MSKEEKMKPEIRFEGFEGEWESRCISDILSVNSGYDYKHLQPGDIPVYGTGGYMLSVDKALSHVDAIGIGRKGTIDKPQFLKAPFWTVDTLFYLTLEEKDFDLNFMYFFMKNINWKKYDESTGVPSLSKTQINKITVRFPSSKEQEKIGNYFNNLDKNIQSKKSELEKFKQFKQAMLQKMFPKEGEKEPEIRFEGFDGEWEEIKIDEIGEVITGNTPSTKDKSNYSSDGIIWITPTDIAGNITKSTEKRLSKTGSLKARIVPSGSILVTCIASIGKNTLVLEKASFNQQINAVVPKNNFDSYFLFTLSTHWSNKMKRVAASGTMQIINRTEFSRITTKIPNYDEQKVIGNYFKRLDDNIEAKQVELEKLKQFKQAMLDKVFV